ncbi:MAG: hypothetical protein ABSD44_14620 [Terracidiphilus sp.]
MNPRPRSLLLRPVSLFLIAICAAILIWTAALPFSRAFLLTEIDYNEGWNVYNTQKVAEHLQLYPAPCGWTTVNYPALSFHLVAALGRNNSGYLFAARILSLAGLCLSGVMAGLIVGHTTRSRTAAWLSGLFLVAFFCANASGYVGMDDPQMLAQAFFMAGIYVYLRGNRAGWALEATALLFVVGGNIKHNLIEFPLAVLLDMLFSAPRKALRFAAGGAAMAALSIVLTRRIDGPAYLACLLAPRGYSAPAAIGNLLHLLLSSPLPAGAALMTACLCWKNPARRVLALLLFCALAANTYFSGGSGVDVNAFFGSMLAMVLLCGVFWAEFFKLPLGRSKALPPLAACWLFFLWLAIPMIRSGNGRTDKVLADNREQARRFAVEVAYLQQQPGPALCESILRCAIAGKPYLYDPFNATRFIEQGKLDSGVIVDQLKEHRYGSLQLYDSAEQKIAAPGPQSTFALPILRAIELYYRPGLDNEDGVIYLPDE